MLYPDLARLKVLANDLCLDALSHAMHRDSGGTLSRLDAAYFLGSELMSQKDELSRLIGMSIFSIVSRLNLRMVEVDPSMIGLIKDRAKTWSPKFEQDPYDTFEWYFLEQMSMCRNFDDPILDRPQLGFPFDKIFKPIETQDFDKGDIRPSNAIPKSHAIRFKTQRPSAI
jgi:hypothetical protein